MNQTIALPVWAFVLILLFAAVTFASHFLFPSVRWFFRKRAERVVARVNERLQRPIEPFKLAKRYDMIQRLIYDPEITEAVVEHARANNVPENVAFETARRYAREIVPSFSATMYFSVGMRLAKWISRAFYRIRLGTFDRDALEALDEDATIVFIMNHRSNMDYVLVTYLVSRAGALSYAVGEWARVWPLSAMIKMMGAYFIRRKSRGLLYRRVLARYVQMATAGGVTQAMFPEGGLSLTGAVGAPKLGLLSYIIAGSKPGGREVIFVPVGLNYDRVLEDRFLVAAGESGKRKFRPPFLTVVRGIWVYLIDRYTKRIRGFGAASVGFGKPLRLSDFPGDDAEVRTQEIADELMNRVRAVVPVLPTPLVALVLLQDGPMSRTALANGVTARLELLKSKDMPLPRKEVGALVTDTLKPLLARGFITESAGLITVAPAERGVISYYAKSIDHHFSASAK